MLPWRDKAKSCLLSLAQARDWFNAGLAWTGKSVVVATLSRRHHHAVAAFQGAEQSLPVDGNQTYQ